MYILPQFAIRKFRKNISFETFDFTHSLSPCYIITTPVDFYLYMSSALTLVNICPPLLNLIRIDVNILLKYAFIGPRKFLNNLFTDIFLIFVQKNYNINANTLISRDTESRSLS